MFYCTKHTSYEIFELRKIIFGILFLFFLFVVDKRWVTVLLVWIEAQLQERFQIYTELICIDIPLVHLYRINNFDRTNSELLFDKLLFDKQKVETVQSNVYTKNLYKSRRSLYDLFSTMFVCYTVWPLQLFQSIKGRTCQWAH